MARRAVSLRCLCRPLVGFSRRTVTQYGDKRRPPPVGKGAHHTGASISVSALEVPSRRSILTVVPVRAWAIFLVCTHFLFHTNKRTLRSTRTNTRSVMYTHGYTQVLRRIPHSPTNRARACVRLTLLTSASQQRQVL